MSETNYDEAKVPGYTLPKVLAGESGAIISNPAQWRSRRAELLSLFEQNIYGRMPESDVAMSCEKRESSPDALNGLATREQWELQFQSTHGTARIDVLLYRPNHVSAPAPVFAGLNFRGNQSVQNDPEIFLCRSWIASVEGHRATEESRGSQASRWPVETIVQRGYAVVTACYHDIAPDDKEQWHNGVYRLWQHDENDPARSGAISLWAWGLSRILDWIEQQETLDAKRVAVHGHSRLGKTALWAGANDERFAIVISNDSGCNGAALARRKFGETFEVMARVLSHWFCPRFQEYSDREEFLPIDQHQLIALMAPRPVYVASAEEDLWADPRGEWLSLYHAQPAFELFGLQVLSSQEMPAIESPRVAHCGYHIRRGKHDMNDYDWAQLLNFADIHWRHL
jgi:hypothetical protein